MTATIHPKPNDDGKPVEILSPSTPTDPGTWHDAGAIATWVPGSPAPDILNGIRMAPWADAPTTWDGWADVDGQMALDEPPMQMRAGKQEASGLVIVEPDGRAWVVSPTNGFGGYKSTFPKGKNDEDLPLQANAIKEAFEESGLKVEVIGLLGDFTRTTSVTRYYLARRVGGSPADMGWESQAVHLVPQAMLSAVLANTADQPVLKALAAALTNKEN